jgi:hypothetical protein
MDTLYYSNHCRHCVKLLGYITRNNLIDSINCVSVDKRVRDTQTNTLYVQLENGRKVPVPPNVHSVPSLIQVKRNYTVIMGDDIVNYLQTMVTPDKKMAMNHETIRNGEPVGTTISNFSHSDNIQSDQYTTYDLTPAQLSVNNVESRDISHYSSANHAGRFINTPDDNYSADKLTSTVTIEMLQKMRNEDVPNHNGGNPNPLGF